jgi:hypothetical protein
MPLQKCNLSIIGLLALVVTIAGCAKPQKAPSEGHHVGLAVALFDNATQEVQATVEFAPEKGTAQSQSWKMQQHDSRTANWDISQPQSYRIRIQWDLAVQAPVDSQNYHQEVNYTFDTSPCIDGSTFIIRSTVTDSSFPDMPNVPSLTNGLRQTGSYIECDSKLN